MLLDICQINVFPSLFEKNTNICLVFSYEKKCIFKLQVLFS